MEYEDERDEYLYDEQAETYASDMWWEACTNDAAHAHVYEILREYRLTDAPDYDDLHVDGVEGLLAEADVEFEDDGEGGLTPAGPAMARFTRRVQLAARRLAQQQRMTVRAPAPARRHVTGPRRRGGRVRVRRRAGAARGDPDEPAPAQGRLLAPLRLAGATP